MQQKHVEEIVALRAELGRHDQFAQHSASTVHRNQHHENENHDCRRHNVLTRMETSTLIRAVTSMVIQMAMKESNWFLCKPFGPPAYSPLRWLLCKLQCQKSPPVLEKYDGSADHLRIFSNAMVFYMNSDPVICRAFSLSLKDEALEWYNTLPPNSVDCFAIVETLFRRQYSSNRKQEITPTELVNTKQEKGETFKAFMKRYTETTRQVKDVNHSFIINNLPSCLRPGYFTEKLYVRPPKTMDELQERVAEFICMEDMRISQRKRQREADVGGGRKDDKRPFGNNDKSGELPRTFKFDHFTTLNAPRAKVLEQALNVELLTLRRKSSPKYADERKSCHFHQNHEHNREECVTLKNEIENLIQAGHLRKYIKEGRGNLPREGYLQRSP
ncbi:uncharacterized protein LOC106765928 [Vigna radiata var. radiata]|uniref:Uncharacterized protein LOC106765928 n=1 Tax=Vigna radiata var. radiata TaxID=3916 RepID=A0A1S3UJH4_VIGRR|nr:uncharacterized protein LOC106765928 [Vigna radiata var. radiata]